MEWRTEFGVAADNRANLDMDAVAAEACVYAVCVKLPTGWKFRFPLSVQDLAFMTDNGKTMITQDELGNTYDRVGGPYSNFKP